MTDLGLTTVFVGFPAWLQAATVPFPEVGENLAPLLKMPLSSLLCEQVDTSTLVFLHARDGVKMSRYFCYLFELSVISLHPTCVLIFCFGKLILWFRPFTFNDLAGCACLRRLQEQVLKFL